MNPSGAAPALNPVDSFLQCDTLLLPRRSSSARRVAVIPKLTPSIRLLKVALRHSGLRYMYKTSAAAAWTAAYVLGNVRTVQYDAVVPFPATTPVH